MFQENKKFTDLDALILNMQDEITRRVLALSESLANSDLHEIDACSLRLEIAEAHKMLDALLVMEKKLATRSTELNNFPEIDLKTAREEIMGRISRKLKYRDH